MCTHSTGYPGTTVQVPVAQHKDRYRQVGKSKVLGKFTDPIKLANLVNQGGQYSTEEEDDTQSGYSRYLNPQNIARGVGSYIGNKISGFNPFTMGFNAMRGKMPYRGATGSAGGYNAAQLNSMNALGGYYSEPARDARRTQSRIDNMMARKAAGKSYSQKTLNKLTMNQGPAGQNGGNNGGNQGGGGFGKGNDPGGGAAGSPFNRGGLASLWQR